MRNHLFHFKNNANPPTYDFPHSPILWIGFLGIAVALATIYTVNKAYFNSPMSDINRGKNNG